MLEYEIIIKIYTPKGWGYIEGVNKHFGGAI